MLAAPPIGADHALAQVTEDLSEAPPPHPTAKHLPIHKSVVPPLAPEAGGCEGAGLWSWTSLGRIPGLPPTSRVTVEESLHLPQPLLSHL